MMKFPALLIASLISTARLIQAQDEEPQVSLVQAAQIAQDTLKSQNLGPGFYLRTLRLTSRQDKPAERIYEARFEPPDESRANSQAAEATARYRVIVVDMQGKGTVEDREFAPRVIRRRAVASPPSE
ncbi:MAG: hypothetical protein IAE97_08495 [Chthoniobacterales bacterium]|nr:hypothetical protein [Chthoniobacterales bacterium]